MAFNSLDKIINQKLEKLNLLKNKFKIKDLEHKIDKFDKYIDDRDSTPLVLTLPRFLKAVARAAAIKFSIST